MTHPFLSLPCTDLHGIEEYTTRRDTTRHIPSLLVGRVVAEVAVVGEAKSEGWTDEDTADARRMAANFLCLETRLVGELFLG